MKGILFIIAVLSISGLQAQTAPAKTLRLSIGLTFSPDYSYRALKNNGGDDNTDLVISNRNKLETGKLGYTGGIAINLCCSGQIGFETGLAYSNKGYRMKERELTYPQPDPLLPVREKTTYNFRYIDIPVKISDRLGKGNLVFVAGAGLVMNFLVNENEEINFYYQDGSSRKDRRSSMAEVKKFNLSPMISFGIEYKLSDKLYLKAEPVFRYGILKTIDQPVAEHLWNAGLGIGCYYSFK